MHTTEAIAPPSKKQKTRGWKHLESDGQVRNLFLFTFFCLILFTFRLFIYFSALFTFRIFTEFVDFHLFRSRLQISTPRHLSSQNYRSTNKNIKKIPKKNRNIGLDPRMENLHNHIQNSHFRFWQVYPPVVVRLFCSQYKRCTRARL